MINNATINRRSLVKLLGVGSAAALISRTSEAAGNFAGRPVVFCSWGGAYQDAEKICYCDPFAAKTGATVLQDGPMNMAKFLAMVESGQPVWDVGDITLDFLHAGKRKNAFEKLDFKQIDVARVDPVFVDDYGIGNISFSYNIGYNTKLIKQGEQPKSWAEAFDVKRFPAPRSFINRCVPMIEVALLADGVAPEKLYPLDVDRAFKKLDMIKDHTVWWDTNSQSQEFIIDGQAAFGIILNGRIYDAVKKGGPIGIEWNQNIQSAGYWVILRGSKNIDAAHGLINEMTVAENQAKLANMIAYSPTNPAAFKDVDPKISSWLSTEPSNAKKGIMLNGAYWAEHQAAVTERWNAWKLS
jgi:putative spermidine/putrescine transport system substrate-binding protein